MYFFDIIVHRGDFMAIIGIDLGTTNSLACTWKDGDCVLIPNKFQEYLTPSVVSIDEEGVFYTGKIAKERLITHPQDTAKLFKRTIGTDQRYCLQGTSYTSEELSSFLLRQLIEDAQSFLNEPIEEAIISVPAYFNDAQRFATKNAGRLAGISVERLINEPSAAALYARNNMEEATYLVFDFGGGTLDISVVECFEDMISILAVSGDNHLGGSDFDEAIAEQFCIEHHFEYESLSTQERSILIRQCEECKIALDANKEITKEISFRGKTYPFTLSSQKLIEIAPVLFERMVLPIQKALKDSCLEPSDLDQIILVGGSSKLKVIQAYLAQTFPCHINNTLDPDTIVARGLGIYTGIKARKDEIKDVILTDICPFTLGIAVHNHVNMMDSLMNPIIERNSPLPCSKEDTFYTIRDHQTKIDLEIYQGESMYCKNNLLLDHKEISVKSGKRGEYPIHVRFTYDINGILEVDVSDDQHHPIDSLTILSHTISMSEEELQIRLCELAKLKCHPRKQAQNALLKNRLERLYEEANSEQRVQIQSLALQFEQLLEKQNAIIIDRERKRMEAIVDQLEHQLHPYTISWS